MNKALIYTYWEYRYGYIAYEISCLRISAGEMTQWAKVLDVKPYIFPGTHNGTKTEQTFPKLSSDLDTYAPTHPHN